MYLETYCMRAVLEAIFEKQELYLNTKRMSNVTFDEICEAVSAYDYSKEQIFYTVRKLSEAGYISLKDFSDDGGYYVDGVSFDGHMFYINLK